MTVGQPCKAGNGLEIPERRYATHCVLSTRQPGNEFPGYLRIIATRFERRVRLLGNRQHTLERFMKQGQRLGHVPSQIEPDDVPVAFRERLVITQRLSLNQGAKSEIGLWDCQIGGG